MRPEPALLQTTGRMRLLPRAVGGTHGIGERRSRQKGAGTDFADFREYAPGDELRHVDPHLHARFGQFHIRRYEVTQHLPVAILLDGSASMKGGKLALAKWLAVFLAHIATVGGDRSELLVRTARRLERSPVFHRKGQSDAAANWLDRYTAETGGGLDLVLREAAPFLKPRSLVIVISDFWLEEPERALRPLGADGREVWAIRILSPEERDPRETGDLLLVDSETGTEIAARVGPGQIAAYRAFIAEFGTRVERLCHGMEGRFLDLDSVSPPGWLAARLRSAGWIG